MKRVVIIGAGASGMMAAKVAGDRGYKVTVLEKQKRCGQKLLITGKGRCNITNNCEIEELIENVPTNGKFLYSAFYTFTNDQVIDMFNDLGVETKTERGKRVFPVSDKAVDVVRALERQMNSNKNVEVLLNSKVDKIIAEDGAVKKVVLSDKREIECDSVIVATGGVSYPKTGSTGDGYRFAKNLGHTIITPKPSLIGLEVMEDYVADLSKLSLRNVSMEVYNKIVFDLKPALDEEKLDKRIQKDFQKYSNKNFENSLNDLLPKQLIPTIVKLSKIDPYIKVNQISKEERKNLVHLIKHISFTVKNYRPIEEAIITSGGIKTSEINSSTMESKLVSGLFFAGEVIDIDAYTGGFNLQIAFSTAYLAGINC